MLPDIIPNYSVGPSFGFATNAVMVFLCLVTLVLYRHYRPLRPLFFFYLFLTFFFLGWMSYGLQKSEASILLGYRVEHASLVLLPACWAWFISALFNEKKNIFLRAMIIISFVLAAFALFGRGPYFFGFPLEFDQIAVDILRPRSKLLRPVIHLFCLLACLYYLFLVIGRFLRFKAKRPVYLLPVGVGLLFWFLGGLHDGLRSTAGIVIFIKDQILWFASFWLSLFLTLAVALHFRSLEQAVHEARDVFERFVPLAYLRRIAAQGLKSIRLGEAHQQWATVLSCDIRGFTSLSERVSPSELIALVNSIFEKFTQVVDKRHGVIDKFLGDAILCTFEGNDSAQRAVACGVDILNVVNFMNADEGRSSHPSIQIGIGLHTGPVILGTIGSPHRMDSTVLGLTVNLAKRLEEITRPLGVDMLISDQVATQLSDGHGYSLRRLGDALVKGSSKSLGILEVYDHNPPDIRNLKDQVEPFISKGIEYFKKGYPEAAWTHFQKAQTISPKDLPLRLLMTSLQNMIEQNQEGKESVLLDFRTK